MPLTMPARILMNQSFGDTHSKEICDAIDAGGSPTGRTIAQWKCPPGVLYGTGMVNLSTNNDWVVNLTRSAANILTLANMVAGQRSTVVTLQDSVGGGTITWAGQAVRWAGGTVGAPTATALKGDIFVFYMPTAGVILGVVAGSNF